MWNARNRFAKLFQFWLGFGTLSRVTVGNISRLQLPSGWQPSPRLRSSTCKSSPLISLPSFLSPSILTVEIGDNKLCRAFLRLSSSITTSAAPCVIWDRNELLRERENGKRNAILLKFSLLKNLIIYRKYYYIGIFT